MNSRVALVTGGTRGIGLAISSRLAHEGFSVAICGRKPAAEVAEAITKNSAAVASTTYFEANISRTEDRNRLIEEVRARFGRLDVLVNNAGVAPLERRDILEATEDSYERVMDTNLKGPHFLTQLAARWMIEETQRQPGAKRCIVFITSVSAELASVNRGEYCLSKAGLSMAARLWSLRLAPENIPVYEVRPGIIRTDMTAPVAAAYDTRIADGLVPEGRWGKPEDVATAVAALARGDLPYATGSILTVDGGLSLPCL